MIVPASDAINWSAYRSFQQALETAGWEHFPSLKAELPDSNDGITPVSAAPALLGELAFFMEEADLGWITVLIDTYTGEELQEYIRAYDGEFNIGRSGYNLGVDENGFFIRKIVDGEPRDVFRAMRVQQILPDEVSATSDIEPMIEFVDLDSGLRYCCSEPMIKIIYWPDGRLQNAEGQIRLGHPLRMHVVKRKREASDFEAVINLFQSIFEAAIKTGNPIRWH